MLLCAPGQCSIAQLCSAQSKPGMPRSRGKAVVIRSDARKCKAVATIYLCQRCIRVISCFIRLTNESDLWTFFWNGTCSYVKDLLYVSQRLPSSVFQTAFVKASQAVIFLQNYGTELTIQGPPVKTQTDSLFWNNGNPGAWAGIHSISHTAKAVIPSRPDMACAFCSPGSSDFITLQKASIFYHY